MTYLYPTDLSDALAAMGQGDRGCVVAGGTDVYPAMAQGQTPKTFLDVTRLSGFRDITRAAGMTRFGAAVTWSDILRADLPPAFDALKQAAREVGSVQIQNAGTIAGNLCNASPAADGVPPLLALNATLELASAARGVRLLALSDFLLGARRTALADDELVTAVLVPDADVAMGSAFEKLGSRRYLVISISMVAANVLLDVAGRIAEARVAVGACSAVAQRLPALEAELIGQLPGKVSVTPAHLGALTPIDDVRGTGAYRLDAAATQCKRAIERASQR